jgi:excisionase family DNA binding protein
MVKPEDAPRLDWLTPTEAAKRFGITRQAVNLMIRSGEFSTLHKVGPESRPQYLVQRSEVEKLKSERSFRRSR